MLSEKIETVVCGLNALAGRVSEDAWNLIKLAGQALQDVALQAAELEQRLIPTALESAGPGETGDLGDLGDGAERAQ